MENLLRLKYGTLKITEWELNTHRRVEILSRHITCAAESKRPQFTCPPTSVHVGKTNDCGDRGSKCAVCECAAGGSGGGSSSSGSRITLRFWLADKGKVTQARRGKVRKGADARQQKERERINGLS